MLVLVLVLVLVGCGGKDDAPPSAPPPPAGAPRHAVAVGGKHACAITPAGKLACWGRPERGRLGHPDADGGAPAVVALPAPAVSVTAGEHHTCALLADGRVACFGASYRKQLGGDTTDDHDRPVVVAGIAGALDVTAGNAFTCALLANHHVACWGGDDDGELGRTAGSAGCIKYEFSRDPGGTCDGAPTEVPGITDALAISAGPAFACAIRADHTLACWGGVELTQVAGPVKSRPEHGTLKSFAVRPIAGLTDAVAISVGLFAACAVRTDGTVWCWGLVDPDSTATLAKPTQIAGLSGIVDISVHTHACAVDRAGHVSCWGHGSSLELGRQGATDTPAIVPGLDGTRGVAAGWQVTCAEARTGEVSCLGNNYHGMLGTFGRDLPIVPVVGVAGATAIAAGTHHACAIVGGGAVRCWGRNDYGQVGAPRDSSMHQLVMTAFAVPDLAGARELALSEYASCARTPAGVACWGDGDVLAPHPLWHVTALDGATAIAIGGHVVCGALASGVRCVSTETQQPVELKRVVAHATGALALAVAGYQEPERICLVDHDHHTRCWGHRLDESGLFGLPMKYFHGLERIRRLDGADRLAMWDIELCAHVPTGVRCASGRDVASAIDVAVDSHTCFVAADGAITCDASATVGAPTEDALDLHALAPATGIALGYELACARDNAGAVRCTGTEEIAGDGRVMDGSMTPVRVAIP